jgi:predicted enzyme related to lactoylglutathione lyase
MSNTHGKFIWAELLTSDPAAAQEFYTTVVGWGASDSGQPGMDYTILDAGGTRVAGLMALPADAAAEGFPPSWGAYVAVDDTDATANAFVENGGKICREPADIPGIGRFAVVADPHGAMLSIMTPLPMDGPPPSPPPGTPGLVGWHELYAGNGEAAFEFYRKIFGWQKSRGMDMGAMGVYQLFSEHGVDVGGMMTKPPEVPVACWQLYFNVTAIDAALKRVQSAGGTVLMGPAEVPGPAWIIQCTDPQGAHFALVAPAR